MTFAQDQGLDVISEGLDTLKNLALDMNEVGYFSWNLVHDPLRQKHILIIYLACSGIG